MSRFAYRQKNSFGVHDYFPGIGIGAYVVVAPIHTLPVVSAPNATCPDRISVLMPVSSPAPEVVDVPQPVVIHKRLAGSEHSASWSSDEPEVVTLYIGRAGEDAPLTLLRAMLAAIDAQQSQPEPAAEARQDRPERPEPRYKVGDWVSLTGGTCPWRVTSVDWLDDYWSCGNASGGGASEKLLTPALDPALHETARRTVAILRKSKYERLPDGASKLPMFREWNNGPVSTREWAAQLERLLGAA